MQMSLSMDDMGDQNSTKHYHLHICQSEQNHHKGFQPFEERQNQLLMFSHHRSSDLNTYRVEYAKELLHAGKCSLEELPQRCGFASRSAFYASFSKIVGMSPLRFLAREQNNSLLESMIYV